MKKTFYFSLDFETGDRLNSKISAKSAENDATVKSRHAYTFSLFFVNVYWSRLPRYIQSTKTL